MNHDYTHCWDYEKGVCPENCFRAVLTEDLKNWPYPVAYGKIKGTDACPITNPPPKPTHYDRIIRKTPEELAEFLAEYRCVHKAPHCMETNCAQCWSDWLRQEEQ